MTTPSTPTSTMKEAEREQFKAAMRDKHREWSFTPDPVFDYHNVWTRCAWEGWQAARSLVEAQPCAVAGEAAMVDGYLGSAMLSSSDAHKIVVSYATREQADKAHEWLSAQVDAAPSAVLPLKGAAGEGAAAPSYDTRQFSNLSNQAHGFARPLPGGVPTEPSDFMVALAFHEAYERLAPSFGYITRPETRSFDSNSPNGKLMIAVIGELRAALSAGAPSSLQGERE